MSAVANNVIRMSVICYHPQFLVRIIRIKVNPNHPQGHHHHTGKKQRSSRRGRVPRSREQINQRLHFPLPAWGGGWSRAADWWNVVSPWIIYIHTLSFSCICSCTHLVYLWCVNYLSFWQEQLLIYFMLSILCLNMGGQILENITSLHEIETKAS